jgi:hypothetical protein
MSIRPRFFGFGMTVLAYGCSSDDMSGNAGSDASGLSMEYESGVGFGTLSGFSRGEWDTVGSVTVADGGQRFCGASGERHQSLVACVGDRDAAVSSKRPLFGAVESWA